MEASAAFHRCVWQVFSRPAQCTLTLPSTKLLPRSTRQQFTHTSSRAFTTSRSSKAQQDAPPQPIPVSHERQLDDTAGALLADTPSRPQQKRRIDLSPLQKMSSPRPSTSITSSEKPSASARLNHLFREHEPKPRPENPYQRTIQQTDKLNNTHETTFDVKSLFEGLATSEPKKLDLGTQLPLRLRPTLGRTTAVDAGRGYDLTRAFASIEAKCRVNSVKQDMIKQKFHVRRGQRRKLDRIRRWRTAFKAGFLEECARIRRMKNQGW